jgi:hypothetical protein
VELFGLWCWEFLQRGAFQRVFLSLVVRLLCVFSALPFVQSFICSVGLGFSAWVFLVWLVFGLISVVVGCGGGSGKESALGCRSQ